jgi:hypothetical protein
MRAAAASRAPIPADSAPSSFAFQRPHWEITQASAWRWFVHRFRHRVYSPSFIELAMIDGDELLLLVYDLACYEGLCDRYLLGRGPLPPALPEYLAPGRENWGHLARLIRELAREVAGDDEA